jgi:hypothetical protein
VILDRLLNRRRERDPSQQRDAHGDQQSDSPTPIGLEAWACNVETVTGAAYVRSLKWVDSCAHWGRDSS